MRALLFVLLLALLPAPDPGDHGRRGNALYEQGQYAEAAEAFRAGLAEASPDDLASRYALLHNLGSALHRLGELDASAEAYAAARALAAEPADVARAAYNAGNTAFRADDLDAATDHYKQALLADPADEAARFNYEIARRRADEQQQQQQQQQGSDEGEQNPQDEQQDGEGAPQDGDEEQPQDGEPEEQESEDGQPGDQDAPPEPQEGQPNEEPGPGEPSRPEELSRQQAEQILEALENEEEQLLRQVQKLKSRPRQVEKDW